jgi:antitoxin MazE
MRAKIARWGNSLALRLPAEVVRDFGLEEGQVVELKPNKPAIEIQTERPRTSQGLPIYTLEELVAEMKRLGPENQSKTLDWGPDRGSEIIDDEYSRGDVTSTPERGRRRAARRR